jgi:hypothetical protein
MCTYCNTKNYRKIYENHIGLISKDSDGRTYEIHHIDGNHSNNDPSNLKAVTIQEHYDIHYAQGDWGACFKIATRMKLLPKEISNLVGKSSRERVKNGTHHWLTKEHSESVRINNIKKVEDGTHKFLDSEYQRKKALDMVKNGTHPFLGGDMQRKAQKDRVERGVHNLLGGEQQKKINQKRVENGTHHFQDSEAARIRALLRIKNGTSPSQIKASCVHCKLEICLSVLGRWHGDNCKLR